ncbi:GNAT family N-acetyltransferase [Streptomyces sp. SP17BM10]|uniref:GNAT family N-acetyltransferase n=1 Tax=Streptomyces sp. SP17BM10 TaxID=3002530 RepID=UPI002E79281B|nr:GNAT family N-acetyltransferase [Streptomyces sp. SP17BM10]MEE1784618.1 GNAT family N-acetyltransferase [Streptomyces sp. SP17BM10]
MTLSTRKATAADRATVLALIDAARGDGLSPQERAERGFVQGRFDEDKLAATEATTGVYVAEEDGRIAGAALTAPASPALDEGPPRRTWEAALHAGLAQDRFYLYGPVVVDPDFRGRGVVRSLLRAVDANLRDRFDHGVLFVEKSNHKSLAVHRHLGMREAAEFTVGERAYAVFVFASGTFCDRPAATHAV